jgi:D-glucosaminate-6-phosphate ammonia-lyase
VKTNRRHFLAGLSAAAPFSYFASRRGVAADMPAAPLPDYFGDLGVRPFINAIGPYSSLGGSEMWPEVIEAMDYAIKNKARMTDLHDAVGKRIAELTGADSAMVSSGATGAIVLATAACMTMGDAEKMESLPRTSDMPNEVIMLKSQRYLYDRSIRAPGAKLVEVETAADIRAAVSDKTAMMFYLLNRPENTKIEVADYIALANEYDIPIFCDAATTVPPVSNILQTVAAGFDLVCYSGGKGLRGPYSAGLLLGRADLIKFARMHGSPNHRAFGRSMKVAPEEYLGMMVAVETSLKYDADAEYERQLQIVNAMGRDLLRIPGVVVETSVPGAEAREPYIEVRWDAGVFDISPADIKQALRVGEPPIEVRALFLSGGQLHLTAVALKNGEAEIVTQRVAEVLRDHATGTGA